MSLPRSASASAAKFPRIGGANWARYESRHQGLGSSRTRRGETPALVYGRVIRTIRTTRKREAKAALAQLEVEAKAGLVVAADLVLREFLERWVAHIRGLGRSAATLYNYEGFIERNINPA